LGVDKVNDTEFSQNVSRFLQEKGFAWAEAAVRRTIDEGVPVRKEVAGFGLSADVARGDDQSAYFSRSEDYTAAFERRGPRKSVEATRPYNARETAVLYLSAVYAALIEPSELAAAGLKFLGDDVDDVVFASEHDEERFTVRATALERSDVIESLRGYLEPIIKHAPRP
jgi:hypothetical protein